MRQQNNENQARISELKEEMKALKKKISYSDKQISDINRKIAMSEKQTMLEMIIAKSEDELKEMLVKELAKDKNGSKWLAKYIKNQGLGEKLAKDISESIEEKVKESNIPTMLELICSPYNAEGAKESRARMIDCIVKYKSIEDIASAFVKAVRKDPKKQSDNYKDIKSHVILLKGLAEPKYKGIVISGALLALLGALMITAGIIFQPHIAIGLTVFLIIGGQLSICGAIGACFKLLMGNNNHLRNELENFDFNKSNVSADKQAVDKQAKILDFIAEKERAPKYSDDCRKVISGVDEKSISATESEKSTKAHEFGDKGGSKNAPGVLVTSEPSFPYSEDQKIMQEQELKGHQQVSKMD